MADELKFVILGQDKFSGAFQKLSSALPSIRTLALGASAAVGGFGAALAAITVSTARAADEIGKFSDRIGISSEALSEYHHVAELSGVSTQTLQMAFQRMTRRVAEAAQGAGEAKGALQELGLPVENLVQMAPDQVFEAITGAMEGVQNQADRTRLAMRLFDSEGVALLQTMTGGVEGLREMREEARRLGLVFDETATRNAARFRDELTRLRGVFTGIKNAIGTALMEPFGDLAEIARRTGEQLIQVFRENQKAIREFGFDFVGVMINIADRAIWALGEVTRMGTGLQITWNIIRQGMYILWEALNEIALKIHETVVDFMEFANVWGVLDDQISRSNAMLDQHYINLELIRETVRNLQTEYGRLTQKYIEHGDTIGNWRERFMEAVSDIQGTLGEMKAGALEGGLPPFDAATVEKVKSNIGEIRTAWEEMFLSQEGQLELWYERHLEMLTAWYEQNLEKQAEYNEARQMLDDIYFERLWKQYNDTENISSQVNTDMAKDADRWASRSAHAATNVFGGALKGSFKTVDDAFKSLAHSMLDMFLDIVAKMITEWLKFEAIMAATKIGGGGFFGFHKGGVMHEGGIVPKAHSGMIVPRLHDGLGPNEFPAILERGEGVFTPDQMAALGAAATGVTINNLNISILPNATNPEALIAIDKETWKDILNERLVPALQELKLAGVTI